MVTNQCIRSKIVSLRLIIIIIIALVTVFRIFKTQRLIVLCLHDAIESLREVCFLRNKTMPKLAQYKSLYKYKIKKFTNQIYNFLFELRSKREWKSIPFSGGREMECSRAHNCSVSWLSYRPPSRCGMKMCPAWSAVRKTSNINIDGPAAPTFVARTDYQRPTYEILFG